MAAPPNAGRLIAPLGCAVEPLVHAPEAIQPAGVGGISVVENAVLEHERAHARPLTRVRGHVGSGRGRHLGDGALATALLASAPLQRRLALVVVLNAALALLLLRVRGVEVVVE